MMKAYSEYKDSNAPWIGKAPEQWEVKKFKYIFNIKKDISGYLGPDVLSITQKGIKVKDIKSGGGQLASDYSKYQLVDVDDYAMNHMDLLTGYVDLSKYEGVTSPDYRVFNLKNPESSKHYFLYLLQLCYQHKIFYPFGQGAAHIGRWRLPTRAFNSFLAPFPSKEEQVKIAKFLDIELTREQKLISEKENFIKLLSEKRQALISHVVTKGLDSNVEMKDSGVEWIGEIPEHWKVSILKHQTRKIGSGKTPSGGADAYQEEGVRFLRSQNVYNDGLRLDNVVFISDETHYEMSGSKVLANDVLLNITGGSIGRTCLVPDDIGDANVNQHVCIIRSTDKGFSKLLSLIMASTLISEQVEYLQTGAGREGLNFVEIGLFKLPLPPKEEWQEIVEYLDNKDSVMQELLRETIHSIKLLKEHRTALISAAVTGKIDVRENT